jgi:hypothetical protein
VAQTRTTSGRTIRVAKTPRAASTSNGACATPRTHRNGSTRRYLPDSCIPVQRPLVEPVRGAFRLPAGEVAINGERPITLRRGLTYAGLLFVTCFGLLQLRDWRDRSEPVSVAAKKVLDAYSNQDIETLWHYSSPTERDAFGMDYSRFEKFMTKYVYANVDFSKKGRLNVDARDDVYQVTQFIKEDGRDIALNFVGFQTPDGPQFNVVTPAYIAVWQKKFGANYQRETAQRQRWRVMLLGMKLEADVMAAYGIRSTADAAPGTAPVPFNDGVQYLTAYFDKNP